MYRKRVDCCSFVVCKTTEVMESGGKDIMEDCLGWRCGLRIAGCKAGCGERTVTKLQY